MLKEEMRRFKLSLFLIFIIIFFLKISSSNFERKEKKEYFSNSLFFITSLPQSPFSLNTLGSIIEERENKEIREYLVQEGDTLISIAKKFNISVETILIANELEENSKLKLGQKLIILPVNGLIHIVKEKETLKEIAEKYKVKEEEIIAFNQISEEILPGDILIVPNGKLSLESKKTKRELPKMSLSFICPISPCRKSQGLHFFNAVDLTNGIYGTPVFAAADGIVQKVGFDKTAGNFVRISHQNGIVTFYAHLSEILVSVGENVFQGQVIGKLGQTGLATGPHLHFEVRGAKNPFAY